MPSPRRDLAALVEKVTPQSVELRRLLHRHPEPAYEEHQTTALIASALNDNGMDYTLRTPKTGLWLDVGGQPIVGLGQISMPCRSRSRKRTRHGHRTKAGCTHVGTTPMRPSLSESR